MYHEKLQVLDHIALAIQADTTLCANFQLNTILSISFQVEYFFVYICLSRLKCHGPRIGIDN